MPSRSTTSNPTPKKKTAKGTFPIVAIGASAGGLEAITELLKYLSPNTGMAFIYVQHLSPDHESMLTSLLAKATEMRVQEIQDKVLIEPNNLYVIPPDKEISVVKRHIKVTPRPAEPKYNLPIDVLFSSLADSLKEKIIGIILSGSANDGTRGIKSIKEEGGLTFAQDESAKFNSMPKSAIATGSVDYILSPKAIALELSRLSDHTFLVSDKSGLVKDDLIESTDPNLNRILRLIESKTGVDFSVYKLQTIKRRIVRRMLLHKIEDLKTYASILAKKNAEQDILFQDLLINVTSFFRDPDIYKYLKSSILPKLLKEKSSNEPVRIWVPACSSGEEAFSIAMMLIEIQEAKGSQRPVQIFASDLSENSIKKARLGVFERNELDAVSPKRLQRFFSKSNGEYRISNSVRELCIFASHNVLTDPPFSKLDLVSCRNLFIYLNASAQKNVLNTFHYALNTGGFLVLGKSEAINLQDNGFTEQHKKFKVYKRKEYSGSSLLAANTPRFKPSESITSTFYPPIASTKASKIKSGLKHNLDSAIDAVLVKYFLPPSVVINHQLEILQFRGSTDLFFSHSAGKATFNILKLVRAELTFSLRGAIAKAIKTNAAVQRKDIRIDANQISYTVGFEVVPLIIESNEPLLLVIFQSQKEGVTGQSKDEKGKALRTSSIAKDKRIKNLEAELARTHAEANEFSNEQSAYIEELQSAHEEVVSSNEELQTVNEELETSKEEIESSNEELITTNQELQTRNDLLIESYEYSEAILSTIRDPLLVLDHTLRIKTANEPFYKKFVLKKKDTEGTLLLELNNKQWDIPDLRKLLNEIIPQNSQFKDFKVIHNFPGLGERVLMLNASRIIQKSHGTQLILLSINDITETIQLQIKEKELLEKSVRESTLSNIKLESAIKERTKALKNANRSLTYKNKELHHLNKELEAFTFTSSHDLQEPLRKIQTFAGKLTEGESKNLSDGGKIYLKHIKKSAERMQTFLQDLLTFTRIKSSEAEFENVSLKILLENIKSDLSEVITNKKAVIKLINNEQIYVIPFLFQQALHNLISNSLKFSRKGIPPNITISCSDIKPRKSNAQKLSYKTTYTHISVADNGIGFEKEYSDRIFEFFEKLHSKDEFPGTGIGLSIVKKVVDSHSGAISVNSKPSEGTTVDIYIPHP